MPETGPAAVQEQASCFGRQPEAPDQTRYVYRPLGGARFVDGWTAIPYMARCVQLPGAANTE
jgi:hypothetical protein